MQQRHIFAPFAARFESAFVQTFSRSRNATFLEKFSTRLIRGHWSKLLALMRGALRTVHVRLASEALPLAEDPPAQAEADAPPAGALPAKRKRKSSASTSAPAAAPQPASAAEGPEAANIGEELREEWGQLSAQLSRLQRQLDKPQEGGMAFAFVEGSLVRALREGHWMLLDEVNLAAPETLERVAAVLEEGGSVALTERGDAEAVPRHPEFRLFAAMNVRARALPLIRIHAAHMHRSTRGFGLLVQGPT